MQFKGKLMNQTLENGRKPNFGPNFGPLDTNLPPLICFLLVLPAVVARHCSSYHPMQFEGNILNQT